MKHGLLSDCFFDPYGLSSFRRERMSDSIMDFIGNNLRGKTEFTAVCLSGGATAENTSNPTANLASYYPVRVRPIDIHDFIIPDPCGKEYANRPGCAKRLIDMHPIAYGIRPATIGDRTPGFGDILTCKFLIAGPEERGKLRGIRYFFPKFNHTYNYQCANAELQSLVGKFQSFGSGGMIGALQPSQTTPLGQRGEKLTRVDTSLATPGPHATHWSKRNISRIKHIILHSTDGEGSALGTIDRFAGPVVTIGYRWRDPRTGKEIRNPKCSVVYAAQGTLPDGTVCHPERQDVEKIVYTSIHYAVGPRGEIVQGLNEDKTANHTKGWNGKSVGIEMVGRPNKNPGKGANTTYSGMYTDTLLNSTAKLVADICKRYNLPIDRNTIKGHDECDPDRKSDPGTGVLTSKGKRRPKNFDWNDFIKRAKSA